MDGPADFLHHPVPGIKARRPLETHSGFQQALHLSCVSIENDRLVRPAVSVGGWHRLSGCLITRPDAPVSSPLLCFAFEGRGFFFSVCYDAFWTLPGTMGVYPGH